MHVFCYGMSSACFSNTSGSMYLLLKQITNTDIQHRNKKSPFFTFPKSRGIIYSTIREGGREGGREGRTKKGGREGGMEINGY